MNKNNENIMQSMMPFIYEITHSASSDKIKVELIKEEIKNNSYLINSKNIANKILEFATETAPELAI